jgi:Protein of unknown function (DUF3306)
VAENGKKITTPPVDEVPARANQEAFFSRWSRLKEETRQAPPEPVPDRTVDPKAPAPELPPLDKLTFESDYSAFFHPKVDDDMRRAALKKLFSDPRFNVMDGLDVYIDDYSKTEPIPPAMLAGLRQAQKILQWAKEDEDERKKEEQAQIAVNQTLELPAAPSAPDAAPQAGIPEAVPAAPDGASKPAG